MSFDGVMLTVLAVLGGLFVGFARRGHLRSMATVDVRAKSLLLIGIAVPAIAEQFTREVAVPLVIGGMAALFAFAIFNVRIVGMSVLGIGVLVNLVPTFLNAGLPVRRDALVDAGIVAADELDRVELRGARRLEEPTHQLRFLGDVVPLPETRQVLSFGDLIVLVGMADVTANLTRMRRRRRDDARSGGEPASDDHLDAALHETIDLDETINLDEPADADAFPTIEAYLARAVRSHVDQGAPYDPRPELRWRPLVTSADDELGWAFDASDHDLTVDDLTDPDDPDFDEADFDEASDLVIDLRDDPETAAAQLLDDDLDAELNELDRDDELDREGEFDDEFDDDGINDELFDPATIEPFIDLVALEAEAARGEVSSDDDYDTSLALVSAAHTASGSSFTAEALDEPFIELAPRRTPQHDDELEALAHADPDELMRTLLGDFTTKARSRRRGGRRIPDFEPIHLDDGWGSPLR